MTCCEVEVERRKNIDNAKRAQWKPFAVCMVFGSVVRVGVFSVHRVDGSEGNSYSTSYSVADARTHLPLRRLVRVILLRLPSWSFT